MTCMPIWCRGPSGMVAQRTSYLTSSWGRETRELRCLLLQLLYHPAGCQQVQEGAQGCIGVTCSWVISKAVVQKTCEHDILDGAAAGASRVMPAGFCVDALSGLSRVQHELE